MSEKYSSPPGLSRRWTWRSTASLSGERLTTQLDTTTSKLRVLEPQLVQPLDVAEAEFDVVAGEAEGLPMVFAMRLGDGELLLGHVDADHPAVLADQLRQGVDVAPGAAAQVQHLQAFEPGRADQAAAVVARRHLRVDARQQRLHPVRHLAGVAAGGGAQVGAAFQLVAVIVLDQFMHVQTSFVLCLL